MRSGKAHPNSLPLALGKNGWKEENKAQQPCILRFVFFFWKYKNQKYNVPEKTPTHSSQNFIFTLTFIFQKKGTQDWEFGIKPSQRHTSKTDF